ncbi:enoyl-CoA hydratase/isomerase family protein [Amorphus sp. 3PC139-8]|uniref:enoyl-CoA hydratase/isomerase family protein n=1 Tax=Amorphus sp. 3PC139-8 TaxID=2735676 RepID=UPI00345C85E4
MSEPIKLTIADGVAEMRFNRPDQLNALDGAMAQAFQACVETVLAEPSVRVILMSGAGRSFMAGGDLAAFRAGEDKPAVARALIEPAHAGLKRLAASPVLTLAVGQGPIAGAGVSLLIGTDLAIVAEGATLNLAYARVGASPDCGGSWALPRLVGQRRALEIALLCDTVDAAEAQRIGLVNRVVPADALMTEARKLAARLAGGPPRALGHTKALLRAALDTPLEAQLDAEAERFRDCAKTDDFSEALEAFFTKRPAKFSGR